MIKNNILQEHINKKKNILENWVKIEMDEL
jgi:hypothetical protein